MAEDNTTRDAVSDELAALRVKVKQQAVEITHLSRVLERKNRQLDALHLVWCDGACSGGVHRWQDSDVLVTEELVKLAERNTKRLRTWYDGVKFRYETWQTASEWHREYAARAAAKTDVPWRDDHRERRKSLGRAWGAFLDSVPEEFWELLPYDNPELHSRFKRFITGERAPGNDSR